MNGCFGLLRYLFFFVILPFRGFEFRSAAHFRWLFHVWAGGVQRWSAIPQSSILNCARAEALCQSSGFLLISFQFYLWTNIFLKIRGLMALLVYPSTVRTLSHRPRLLQLRFNRVLDRLVTSSTYSLLRFYMFFTTYYYWISSYSTNSKTLQLYKNIRVLYENVKYDMIRYEIPQKDTPQTSPPTCTHCDL